MQKEQYRKKIAEALEAAETIQSLLWDGEDLKYMPFEQNKQTWLRVFQKRIEKIEDIDTKYPSWRTELRKRLLQQASLSINALYALGTTEEYPQTFYYTYYDSTIRIYKIYSDSHKKVCEVTTNNLLPNNIKNIIITHTKITNPEYIILQPL